MLRFLCSLSVLFLLLTSGQSAAATFSVSNTEGLRQALIDAAGNRQNDTIILAAGAYKTTDDGSGTFEFNDNEPFDLVIKSEDGLNRGNVIIEGDNFKRVFKFTNPQHPQCSITLERISVINNHSDGIDSDCNLNIVGSGILSRSGAKGISSRGGIASEGSIIID
ncbi:MAG: hypothetical protein JSW20_13675 [Nitrospiraceae bacterium]|nr:MAG: hypothetical protein JSW20_13675 [Nitrospiraceae bacterium]